MLTHDASLITAIGRQFQSALVHALDTNDDIDLWSAAVGQIIADAEFLCQNPTTTQTVFAKIGRCSHWLRPHQTRWTADGGFAWPSGYGGSGYSRSGLPEFDWSLMWQWNASDHKWEFKDKLSGKRRLQLRIAIPSRSTQHNQVAVHTLWSPGCPTTPTQKLIQFYGFRFHDGAWRATAYRCTNDDAYNRTSSHEHRTEQSHALEPAAGSVSNGESSPPAQ